MGAAPINIKDLTKLEHIRVMACTVSVQTAESAAYSDVSFIAILDGKEVRMFAHSLLVVGVGEVERDV